MGPATEEHLMLEKRLERIADHRLKSAVTVFSMIRQNDIQKDIFIPKNINKN